MVRRGSGEVVSNGIGFLVVDDQLRIKCDYLFAETRILRMKTREMGCAF